MNLPLEALALLFALCSASLAFAYYTGFFIPIHRRINDVLPIQTLGAFALFLVLQLILLPLGTYLIAGFFKVQPPFKSVVTGWYQIFSICVVGMVLFCYSRWLKKGYRWFQKKGSLSNIRIGMLSWLIAYPAILLLTQILSMILHQWLGFDLHEQLAVNQVQSVKPYPLLLTTLVLCMVTVVPFIEEVLFRGYLQESLQPYFRPWTAVTITALIFSLFHFSLTQGASNLLILSALFLLALLLGYLKERQASLWSSVALHATFNGISLVQILLIE
jgi:membrane protease YdiL (CAAX protease family)